MKYTSYTREAFKRGAKASKGKNLMIPYYYRKKYGKHCNCNHLENKHRLKGKGECKVMITNNKDCNYEKFRER